MRNVNNNLDLKPGESAPLGVGRMLWDRKGLIFLFTFLTFAVVFITTLLIRPVWRSTAKILVKEVKFDPAEILPSYVQDEEFLRDQAEIIRSKSLIVQTLEEGQLKQRLQEEANKLPLDIDRLQKNITATPLNRTNIIELAVDNTNPVLAKSLSAALINTYSDYRRTANITRIDNALSTTNAALRSAQQQLDSAEQELQDYTRKEEVAILPETEIVLDFKRFATLDAALIDIDSDIRRVDAKIVAVNKELLVKDLNSLTLPFLVNSPVINDLRDKMQDAEITLINLATEYTASHPEVIKTHNTVQELRTALENEKHKIIAAEMEAYQLEKKTLESKKEVLTQANNNYTHRLRKTLASQPVLSSLLNTIRHRRKVYQDLLDRQLGLKIIRERAASNPGTEIVETPDIPLYPLRPKLALNLLLGLIAGLCFGCSAAIFFPADIFKSAAYSPGKKEQRKNLRFPTSADIIYTALSRPYVRQEGSLINISDSGLRFATEGKPEKNSRVRLEIFIPGSKPILAQGKIIWTHEISLREDGRGPFNVGVKFTKIKSSDKKLLQQSCLGDIKV